MKNTQISNAEVDDAVLERFTVRFNLEKFIEIFAKEEPNKLGVWYKEETEKQKQMGIKYPKVDMREFDRKENYEIYYPDSVKYLTQNVFLSQQGAYYVNSVNTDGAIIPTEMPDKSFSKFLAKFPLDMKTYFIKHYAKVYSLCVSPSDPKIFKKGDVDYLNLFQGYKFDGLKRNQLICDGKQTEVRFIWEHIRKMWCNSNQLMFEEVQRWISALIAGRRKMRTAIYLKGQMGIGKGKIVDFLANIIGNLNSLILNTEHAFTGQFNGQLAGKTFVNLNEIVSGSRDDWISLYNRLKPWITDDYMTFRDLYTKPVVLKNLCSFIMTGNHDMFKLESSTGSDRRFIILDSCDTLENTAYYVKLDEFTANDKVQEAFYWNCVDNYDPKYNEQQTIKTLPITETKQNMILKTLSTITQYLKSRLEEEDFFNTPYKKTTLHEDYRSWQRAHPTRSKPFDLHEFCNELTKEYKDVIQLKQVRIPNEEGIKVPIKDCFVIDGKKLYETMKKKGYISKFDDICDSYKSDSENIQQNLYNQNLKITDMIEYWQLEQQKIEIEQKQKILEMKMLGCYDEYLSKKLNMTKKSDPLEDGVDKTIQTISQKKHAKRIIPTTKQIKEAKVLNKYLESKNEAELESNSVSITVSSKEALNKTRLELNAKLGNIFQIEF